MYIKSRTQNNKTIQTHNEKYSVTRVKEGVMLSSIGGLFAGLLGVGGGVIFVPIMNRIMNVPINKIINSLEKFLQNPNKWRNKYE